MYHNKKGLGIRSKQYAEDVPISHKCKYCNRNKDEVTFRWAFDKKTKNRIKPYDMCIKCMYDTKVKRKYSKRGALIKKRIDAYFKEKY